MEDGEKVQLGPEGESPFEEVCLVEVGAIAVGAPDVLPLLTPVVGRAGYVAPVSIHVFYEVPELVIRSIFCTMITRELD